jgi:hypothetical protein
MTYSYISSVFPNYEVSKLYDDNVYNNIMKSKAPVSSAKSVQPYGGGAFQNFEGAAMVEKFETTVPQPTVPTLQGDCKNHMDHVMECKECQEILRAHLRIEAIGVIEQRRNEELIELASYVFFGIFVILMLDLIQKRERL